MGLAAVGSAVLSIKVLMDASKAAKELGDAATGVQKFQSKLGGAVAPAGLVGGALIGLGKSALDAASDSQQAMGGIETVFGKSADQVKAWGDQAGKTAGLSATEYATAAAKIGAQLKTAGVPLDQIAGKTKTLIQQGADLSATYGGSAAEAVDSLSSALRGESDPAERLGLGISAAAVAAEMMAEGTSKLTGKAATAAKAQATLALITKQGAASAGQFAAQAGTAAEQQQIAGAAWKNAAATLGAVLLPAVSAVSGLLAKMADWLAQNKTVTYALIAIVATLAGGILAVSAALRVYTAFQKIWAAATKAMAAVQWLLNAAMSANPVALLVIAIVALVAGIVLLWNKSAAFRAFILGMWAAIQAAAQAAWTAIQVAAAAVWRAIQVAFTAMGTAIKAVAGALKTAVIAVWTGIKAAAQLYWTIISTIVKTYIRAIVLIVRGLVAVAKAVWTAIQVAAQAVWTAIKIGVQALGTAIKAVWTAIQTAASAVWTGIKTVVQREIDGIKRIWEGLTTAVSKVWDGIKTVVSAAFDWIKGIVQADIDLIVKIWDGLTGAIKTIWDEIGRIISAAIQPIRDAIEGITELWDSTVGALSKGIDKVTGWISGLWGKITGAGRPASGQAPAGFAVTPNAAGVGPALSATAMSGPSWSSGRGAGPTIVVQGALDPDAVARQIERLLTGRARRAGGIRIGQSAAAAI